MNEDILLNVVEQAKKSGVEHVDIIATESQTISVISRLKKIEQLTEANIEDVQVRASIGNQQAIASTNSIEDLKNRDFIEKLVDATKNSPADTFSFQPNKMDNDIEQLPLCDSTIFSKDDIIKYVTDCEEHMLSTSGITNSEGAEFSYSNSKIILRKDYDFCQSYSKTLFQASAVPLAENDGELQQDYAFTEGLFLKDIQSAEQLSKDATTRTLRKVGSRKIDTCSVPVIFDRRCTAGLLSSLVSSINGANIANGMSFLKDKINQKIMTDKISIFDTYNNGVRARPFDSDGLKSQNNELIVDGVLNAFLLNTRYANQLNMKSTHSASGFKGIAPNNVYMQNGTISFEDMIADIKQGLLITETMGDGLNIVTGNYSTGACGLWIENGEIQYPVNEITIAGTFDDLFANSIPASDLKIRTGYNAPSLFVPNLTIGGK